MFGAQLAARDAAKPVPLRRSITDARVKIGAAQRRVKVPVHDGL